MNLYLDASVLVPLFVAERQSIHTRSALKNGISLVSDFAAAEFSAVLGRIYRERKMSREKILSVFDNFDTWMDKATVRITTQPEDIKSATHLVRRLELGLRAPDALHIAIALRENAKLFTFDQKMAAAAQLAGIETIS